MAGDAKAAWEMLNDPVGADLTATTESFDRAAITEWYATRNDQEERIDLALVENATGQWAGEVVLNEYDATSESANFRIALRGPAWFGRGLGSEATALLIEHGLRVVGLRTITLGVLARNPRARRAYEKAGFVVTSEYVENGETWINMEVSSIGV